MATRMTKERSAKLGELGEHWNKLWLAESLAWDRLDKAMRKIVPAPDEKALPMPVEEAGILDMERSLESRYISAVGIGDWGLASAIGGYVEVALCRLRPTSKAESRRIREVHQRWSSMQTAASFAAGHVEPTPEDGESGA